MYLGLMEGCVPPHASQHPVLTSTLSILTVRVGSSQSFLVRFLSP